MNWEGRGGEETESYLLPRSYNNVVKLHFTVVLSCSMLCIRKKSEQDVYM